MTARKRLTAAAAALAAAAVCIVLVYGSLRPARKQKMEAVKLGVPPPQFTHGSFPSALDGTAPLSWIDVTPCSDASTDEVVLAKSAPTSVVNRAYCGERRKQDECRFAVMEAGEYYVFQGEAAVGLFVGATGASEDAPRQQVAVPCDLAGCGLDLEILGEGCLGGDVHFGWQSIRSERWGGVERVWLEGLPCGPLLVRAQGEGCATLQREFILVQENQRESMVLPAAGDFGVRVVDGLTGAPVEGAVASHRYIELSGRSGRDGVVRLPSNRGHGSRYVISAEGYRRRELPGEMLRNGRVVEFRLFREGFVEVECEDGNRWCAPSVIVEVLEIEPMQSLETDLCKHRGDGIWICPTPIGDPDSVSEVSATSGNAFVAAQLDPYGENRLMLPGGSSFVCFDTAISELHDKQCFFVYESTEGVGAAVAAIPTEWYATEYTPGVPVEVAVWCEDNGWRGTLLTQAESGGSCERVQTRSFGAVCIDDGLGATDCILDSFDGLAAVQAGRAGKWSGGCSPPVFPGRWELLCRTIDGVGLFVVVDIAEGQVTLIE